MATSAQLKSARLIIEEYSAQFDISLRADLGIRWAAIRRSPRLRVRLVLFGARVMGSIPRSVLRAARLEAARHGLTATISHKRGKHPKLTVTNGQSWRRQPISGSRRSDDQNQTGWVRQQVRRMARTMGGKQ